MGWLDDYKPAMVMVGLQFTYSGVAVSTRAAILQGMNPRVFVVYRQAIATLLIAPLAYFTRRKKSTIGLGWKSFWLIFLASFIGVTLNQNVYFEGLYLASSSVGSAMSNLVPAVTFVMAAAVGLEKVNIRSLRSIAKILGTIFCVSGAIAMALLKGPKLLNAAFLPSVSIFSSGGGDNWLLGCLFLFGNCFCWSFWLIIQVPVSANYPDHLLLSGWMCFMATIQSAILALFLERDVEVWNMHSYLELGCCFYAGVIGSGLTFFAQSWCISKRGPLYSAMFNPLNTVIVAIFASIFLHEEIYLGSVVGAFGVILGLYVVLWGKAKDLEEQYGPHQTSQNHYNNSKQVLTQDSLEKTNSEIDLEKPLLS